jgi:hypothetical protein
MTIMTNGKMILMRTINLVDVELTGKEYDRILKWFFLAFAKLPSEVIENDDKKLKIKLEIMRESQILFDDDDE